MANPKNVSLEITGDPTISSKNMHVQLLKSIHEKCVNLRQQPNKKDQWETKYKTCKERNKTILVKLDWSSCCCCFAF